MLVTARYVRDARRRGPVAPASSSRCATPRPGAATERSRAELISTVAHELRSPLTSVKGFTATLLAKWDRFTDDQKRLMLETVDADADRVTRLITELLDISRIDSGRLEVRRQPVDIAAAVRPARRRPRRRRASPRTGSGCGSPAPLPETVGRPRQDRPDPRQPAGERGAARRGHCHHRGGSRSAPRDAAAPGPR